MSIDVNNESGAVVDEAALSGLARSVLDTLGVTPLAELSILLADVAAMATLHEQWMDLPGPTDVMAFPMDMLPSGADSAPGQGPGAPPEPGPALLGDIILCPEVAAAQAVYGRTLDRVGVVPAHHARCAPPARLRPRHARGRDRDVRRCRPGW